MSKLLIQNIEVISTMDEKGSEFQNCDILINGPVIEKIMPEIPVPEGAKIIDGRGKIAFPGFVNVHHHMYQIYTRDLPRILSATDLFDWLRLNYKIWGFLDEEMIYVSTLVGLSSLIKTGCTLVSDMHYIIPEGENNKLIDAEIRAAKELGIRFHPTRGGVSILDKPDALAPRNVSQSDEDILLDYERMVNTYHDPSPFSMLRIGLAPVNPVTSTEGLLKETIRFARKHNLVCHTHLAESIQENQWSMDLHGVREFDYMESIEWVGPDVWFAHCLHLTDDEIKRMGKYRCGVAHCPVSNAKLGSIARIFPMLEQGVRIGFGVDGMGGFGDMVAELQIALILHSYNLRSQDDKTLSKSDLTRTVLRIASKGGAEVLCWDKVGSLESGKAADIILFDIERFDFAGSITELVASFVYYGSNHFVDTSIINGKIVVENGNLIGIDEEAITERANKLSAEYIKRVNKNTGIDYTKPRVQ
jgi:cytosine/adenosine deaminase-related metal-dependent hydrolase